MRLSERLFGSIGVRLSIQLSALFALFATACGVLMSYQLSNVDETARSLRLQREAAEISKALHFTGQGLPIVQLPVERMARYQGRDPASFYLLRNGAGDLVLISSPALQDRFGSQFLRALSPGEIDTVAEDGLDRAFYFLSEPIQAPDRQQFMLTVGRRASETDGLLRDVEWRLLVETGLIAIPICLAVFGASLLIIRFGFAPIRRLSQEAQRIGPADPDARILEADLPEELRDLAAAANGVAARLQQAITTQRRFTADTAHQLLTPLALLSARIQQSAILHPDPGLRTDIVRMQNLVRQLLNLSRLAAGPQPCKDVDLRTVAKDVVTAMAPLAIAEGRNLSYEATDVPSVTEGDPAAIAEALANVIRNGLRHTAPGTSVDIVVEQPASICVSDKGQGIAEEHRDRVMEPFFTTETEKGGSGLGLAIVDQVMRQHGGGVEFENRPEGGARFRLNFRAV
ncbi:HAMP domain-containing histidine kinase [bacterium M00.F.Ca.ET.230.01.1.1]|nr:HAMP domain-containing histidine kinase [bacterium M00.F.Ca.ET.230.01.1.1]